MEPIGPDIIIPEVIDPGTAESSHPVVRRILWTFVIGLAVLGVCLLLILAFQKPSAPIEAMDMGWREFTVVDSYWREDGVTSYPLSSVYIVKLNVSNGNPYPVRTEDLLFHLHYNTSTFLEHPATQPLMDPRFPGGELKWTTPVIKAEGVAEGWVIFLVPRIFGEDPDGIVTVGMRHTAGGDGPESDFFLPKARDLGGAPARLSLSVVDLDFLEEIGTYRSGSCESFVVYTMTVTNLWSRSVEISLLSIFHQSELGGDVYGAHPATTVLNDGNAHVVVPVDGSVTIKVAFFEDNWTADDSICIDDSVIAKTPIC